MFEIVRPESVRLDLTDGNYLIVKKRLNHGEQTEMFKSLYVAGIDGSLHANPLRVGMARILAYLLDWSATSLPIRGKSPNDVEAILNSFESEDVAVIRAAIDNHIAQMEAERDAEKKDRDGGSRSPAISPSRGDVAGGTSGSVN